MTAVEVMDKVALSFTIATAIVFSVTLLSVAAELKDKVMAAVGLTSLFFAGYTLIKYLLW